MDNQLIEYLRQVKTVPEEDAQEICAHFDRQTYQEGSCLFEGNKVCRVFYFVCQGILRIATTKKNGTEATHYFHREGNFCTILQSFNDGTITDTGIYAACNAEVLAISKSKLQELYKRFPYLQDIVEELHRGQLLHKVNIRNTYLGEDAESRYKIFLQLQPDIALRVPLKDVASYLGITPQSLSRIRRNMQ